MLLTQKASLKQYSQYQPRGRHPTEAGNERDQSPGFPAPQDVWGSRRGACTRYTFGEAMKLRLSKLDCLTSC